MRGVVAAGRGGRSHDLGCRKDPGQALAIGARLLSRPASALRFDAEGITDGETGRMLTLAELVAAAYAGRAKLPIGMREGSRRQHSSSRNRSTVFPTQPAAPCAMELYRTRLTLSPLRCDLETGETKVMDYLVVHDCGIMVNPALSQGQVRGGAARRDCWDALTGD